MEYPVLIETEDAYSILKRSGWDEDGHHITHSKSRITHMERYDELVGPRYCTCLLCMFPARFGAYLVPLVSLEDRPLAEEPRA